MTDWLCTETDEPDGWFRWTDMDGYVRITKGLPSVDHLRPDADVVPFDPRLPEGWVVVPVEPTREMLLAYEGVREAGEEWDSWPRAEWAAMLAAAPDAARAAVLARGQGERS